MAPRKPLLSSKYKMQQGTLLITGKSTSTATTSDSTTITASSTTIEVKQDNPSSTKILESVATESHTATAIVKQVETPTKAFDPSGKAASEPVQQSKTAIPAI